MSTMEHAVEVVTPALAELLAELVKRGITLEAGEGDRLRFQPRSAMTPELAQLITANKPALLAMLRRDRQSDKTSRQNAPSPPHEARVGVSSDLSVSEPRTPGKALWSEQELSLLENAGTSRDELPLVEAVKDIFADLGATVVKVESVDSVRAAARRRAAQLIREARRIDPGRAVAMRDAWRERVATCMIEGGLPLAAAEKIALDQVEAMGPPPRWN